MNKYAVFKKNEELYVAPIRGGHDGEELVSFAFPTEEKAEDELDRILNGDF